jgi:hypothetical protein
MFWHFENEKPFYLRLFLEKDVKTNFLGRIIRSDKQKLPCLRESFALVTWTGLGLSHDE